MPLPFKIVFSDKSWAEVKECIENTSTFEDLRPLVKRKDCDRSLAVTHALRFARWKLSQEEGSAIHELLKNAEVIFPEPEIPPRSKELEARIEQLKIKQQKYEYDKMVENLHTVRPSESRHRRVPVISGLNFAVTVIACVFGASFALSNIVPDFLLRCAIGFAVGIVLMCIEIFLAVRAVMKDENEENNKKRQ